MIQQKNAERILKGNINKERDVYKVNLLHFNDLRMEMPNQGERYQSLNAEYEREFSKHSHIRNVSGLSFRKIMVKRQPKTIRLLPTFASTSYRESGGGTIGIWNPKQKDDKYNSVHATPNKPDRVIEPAS